MEQRKTGTITITDERMTRFWIKLEEGARFVVNCINRMKGGEIFIPKIYSMKIMDLAEAIAPDTKKKVVGIRPGEKIHEILLTEDEAKHSREFKDSFLIEPEHPFWNVNNLKEGKVLPDGFRYTSENNDKWLTKGELMKIIKEL
jgi:UDP-N-acetylglucosamine 4,6-dehydratase